MGRDLLKNRPGFWWLPIALLGATAAAATAWVIQDGLVHEPGAGHRAGTAAIRIQSDPWRVGADVDLSLQSAIPRAGQVISLTLLAPGSGLPQIEGLSPIRARSADFFGLSGVQIPWLLPEYRESEMALAAAAGARYVGLDFDWRRLEPQRGQYVWQDTNEALTLAKQHGLRLAPMLLYTPHWASTAPFAPLDYQHAPPADYADYRDFVYAVVNRYKPYGVSSLTADGYGISDWVIWNEPNMRSQGEAPEPGDFWTGSLEEYLLVLRAGYEGAHAADPDCNVLNGGLADVFWAEGGPYLPRVLEQFYDPNGDGDAGDGARPFFDTLNVHTYQLDTPDAAWYEDRLAAILNVMERFGDGDKSVWITETGYGSVAGPVADSPFVDEETQADAVALVYRALSAYPQVERVFWWSLRDYHDNDFATNEAMEGHYGLLRASFEPKPAYLAYAQLTGSVGQVLTMTAVMDEGGVANTSVPASFVSQPGEYVVFVSLDGAEPTVVLTYQASVGQGAQN